MELDTLASLLRRMPARGLPDEAAVQEAIERALTLAGVPFVREAVCVGGRIDFLVGASDGTTGIGVEVKVGGSVAALIRQVSGYAEEPRIASLLVVTTLHRLARMPRSIGGLPVDVVWLGGGML